jgi:uncharacterized protein YlaN (UPF0358 family)
LVEVGRYLTMVEADLARLLLGSHGIEALVLDSQMNNFYGGVAMPVRLVVDDDDQKDALAVLAEDRG